MRKYTLEHGITALKNPKTLLGEVRALGLKLNAFYHNQFVANDGIKVVDEDWDTLVILDGCRYDLFAEVNDLDGDLSSVRSRGSSSVGFLTENFGSGYFHDLVYVSANPYTYKLDADHFHRIVDLLQTEWDRQAETVMPENVVERTLEIHAEHPHKRLIVHFMQPHYPFIGERGADIDHRGYKNKHDDQGYNESKYTVWGRLQYNLGDLSEDVVWAAYRENLEIVLKHVETLIEKLEGKTVITADHGNLIGERLYPVPVKGYGHPGGIRIEELVRVPWLELNYESRRDIVAEPPVGDPENAEADIKKLRALGYVQ